MKKDAVHVTHPELLIVPSISRNIDRVRLVAVLSLQIINQSRIGDGEILFRAMKSTTQYPVFNQLPVSVYKKREEQ